MAFYHTISSPGRNHDLPFLSLRLPGKIHWPPNLHEPYPHALPRACGPPTTASLCFDGFKRYWTGKITSPKCPGALGQQACWTYLTYIGHSDGGRVQDLALAQQIKDKVHQVANLSVGKHSLYRGFNLTSLQRLTQVLDTSLFTQHLLNTTYSLGVSTWLNTTNPASTLACWICLPLTQTSYIGIPVLPDWSPDNDTSPNNVTYTLGPVAAQIPVDSVPNYTCVVSPSVTSWGKLQPSLCTHNLSVPSGALYCA